MTDKACLVRFKPREMSLQIVIAARAEFHDKYIALLDSKGKLAALLELRSSRWYTSLGDVRFFRCSSFTASENADVAASYSVTSRAFSSQATTRPRAE